MELADLTTPAGERLSGTPWQEYPRPQLKRDNYVNLNGYWDFTVNESPAPPQVYGRKILVPFCPESKLSGIGRHFPEGSGLWYRRSFTLPEEATGRVLLHIGAADQVAEVYVNRTKIGIHFGGYEAFCIDITDALQPENTLEIRVTDDLESHIFPYGKQVIQRGGMWYTPVSGIWQTVWLEWVPENYVNSLDIQVTLDAAHIQKPGLHRIDLLSHHHLHSRIGIHRHGNGIFALMLLGSMGAGAVEFYPEAHAVAALVAAAEADGADGILVIHMQRDDAVDVIHDTVFRQFLAARLDILLRRGKQQLHTAPELILPIQQLPGSGQQNGGVAIMTAGVHHAIDPGAAGNVIFLMNGQSVHIRPQADDEPVCVFLMDGRHNAAAAELLRIGDTHGVQLPANHCQRSGQIEADLRTLVQFMAQSLRIRNIIKHGKSSKWTQSTVII